MPVQEKKECSNCGHYYDKEQEKCNKCGMYYGEDPVEYQKFLDNKEED